MDRSSTLARNEAGDDAARRRLRTAELLAIGSELTTGDTRDSNTGDLARSLAEHGVRVSRIVALPDDRAAVAAAFRDALDRADLVVSTGGLGPTPDDLTREAIADAIDEVPAVDAVLERWLRALWARRGAPFPDSNLKQAWLVPSAAAIANAHGTAPGWWLERPDGRVVVALPGPPREMHPMWQDEVVPRLVERGLGRPTVARTLRLAGIGESQVAERIGADLLRAANPEVATFARADGVDVRVIAEAEDERAAASLASDAVERVRAAVGDHVWAEAPATWPEVVDAELARRDLRLVTRETGTGGSLVALLATAGRFVSGHVAHGEPAHAGRETAGRGEERPGDVVELRLHVRPTPSEGDLEAWIEIDGPDLRRLERATAFLRDDQGRARAAVLAAWALLRILRERPEPTR